MLADRSAISIANSETGHRHSDHAHTLAGSVGGGQTSRASRWRSARALSEISTPSVVTTARSGR